MTSPLLTIGSFMLPMNASVVGAWGQDVAASMEASGHFDSEAVSTFSEHVAALTSAIERGDGAVMQDAKAALHQITQNPKMDGRWRSGIVRYFGNDAHQPKPSVDLYDVSHGVIDESKHCTQIREEIEQRAKKHGYDFPEAIDFCLGWKEPRCAAMSIEAAMARFAANPAGFKPSSLTTVEKIAIYATAKKAGIFRFRDSVFTLADIPPLKKFEQYLEFISRFPELGYINDVEKALYSVFVKSMQPHSIHLIPHAFYTHTFFVLSCYDILIRLNENIGADSQFLRRIQTAYFNANVNGSGIFISSLYILGSSVTRERAEAALILLEAGLSHIDAALEILNDDNPIKEAENFRAAVAKYSANPFFDRTYGELSLGERAGIYDVYCDQARSGLSFFNFDLRLKFASQTVRRTGKPVAIRDIEGGYVQLKYELFTLMTGSNDGLGENFTPALMERARTAIANRCSIRHREAFLAFFYNLHPESSRREIKAAIELLEADIAISGTMFQRFVRQGGRAADITKRANKLRHGKKNFISPEDPIEVAAVVKAIGHPLLTYSAAQYILRNAHAPQRKEGVVKAVRQFPIQATLQMAITKKKVNCKLIERLRAKIRKFKDINNVVERIKRLSSQPDMTMAAGKVDVVDVVSKLLAEQAAATCLEKGKNYGWYDDETREDLLIIYWMYKNGVQRLSDIMEGDINEAKEEVVLKTVRELQDFYSELRDNSVANFRDAVNRSDQKIVDKFCKSFVPRSIHDAITQLNKQMKKIEMIDEKDNKGNPVKANITMIPILGPLGVFCGFAADNCLCEDDAFAIHIMSDPDFVPYFMLVDGKIKGAVMTYTRDVTIAHGTKRKLLIVTGIDMQDGFYVKPSEFMDGFIAGFERIAEAGTYDYVVIPVVEGMQARQRESVGCEIRERYTKRLTVRHAIGFPRKGLGEGGSAFYHDAKQHDFLVMWRRMWRRGDEDSAPA